MVIQTFSYKHGSLTAVDMRANSGVKNPFNLSFNTQLQLRGKVHFKRAEIGLLQVPMHYFCHKPCQKKPAEN